MNTHVFPGVTTKEVDVSYVGQTFTDTVLWYCPYMPLTISKSIDPKDPKKSIWQNESNLWMFYFSKNTDINAFQWLRDECTWSYKIHVHDEHHHEIAVEFFSAPAAVEFKLRFCGV